MCSSSCGLFRSQGLWTQVPLQRHIPSSCISNLAFPHAVARARGPRRAPTSGRAKEPPLWRPAGGGSTKSRGLRRLERRRRPGSRGRDFRSPFLGPAAVVLRRCAVPAATPARGGARVGEASTLRTALPRDSDAPGVGAGRRWSRPGFVGRGAGAARPGRGWGPRRAPTGAGVRGALRRVPGTAEPDALEPGRRTAWRRGRCAVSGVGVEEGPQDLGANVRSVLSCVRNEVVVRRQVSYLEAPGGALTLQGAKRLW